mgnify:CR=1 FL=1
MPRIQPVDHATATGEAKTLLDSVKSAIGMVPNIFATFAQSPKALEGFLALSKALGQGRLSARLREQIALSVAGANGCDYCASAHSAVGQRNLQAQSADPKVQAALVFARTAVERRGQLADGDVAALRAAGYSEGEIVEIVVHIGVNLLTNYFNHIAGTEIDFPVVRATAGARAA